MCGCIQQFRINKHARKWPDTDAISVLVYIVQHDRISNVTQIPNINRILNNYTRYDSCRYCFELNGRKIKLDRGHNILHTQHMYVYTYIREISILDAEYQPRELRAACSYFFLNCRFNWITGSICIYCGCTAAHNSIDSSWNFIILIKSRYAETPT